MIASRGPMFTAVTLRPNLRKGKQLANARPLLASVPKLIAGKTKYPHLDDDEASFIRDPCLQMEVQRPSAPPASRKKLRCHGKFCTFRIIDGIMF